MEEWWAWWRTNDLIRQLRWWLQQWRGNGCLQFKRKRIGFTMPQTVEKGYEFFTSKQMTQGHGHQDMFREFPGSMCGSSTNILTNGLQQSLMVRLSSQWWYRTTAPVGYREHSCLACWDLMALEATLPEVIMKMPPGCCFELEYQHFPHHP